MSQIEEEIKGWWKEYKMVAWKPRMECTIEEMEKKYRRGKKWIKALALSIIPIWALLMDLWIEGKTSIILNTLFLLLVIALSAEITDHHNLQLFMYLKKKELKKMENFPWIK